MAISKPIILAENIIELGTPTATDTNSDTDYSVLHIKDRRTHTYWQAASLGTKYLTVDCGEAVTVDALGICGHNLYTSGATVSVECSSDNFSGDTTVALAGFTVTSNRAILKTFTSVSKRYWRIKIVTAAIAPRVAVAFLGDRVTFSRQQPKSGFDPMPEKVVSESVRSNTGNLLGSVQRYISHNISMTIQYVTTTWIEATFRGLWNDYLSQLYPFFLAWEIGEHSTEVVYGKIPDDFELKMPYDAAGSRTITLKIEAIRE